MKAFYSGFHLFNLKFELLLLMYVLYRTKYIHMYIKRNMIKSKRES